MQVCEAVTQGQGHMQLPLLSPITWHWRWWGFERGRSAPGGGPRSELILEGRVLAGIGWWRSRSISSVARLYFPMDFSTSSA